MICVRTPAGWDLVYQNAHARLAADLLRPLRRDLRPARWDALLHAAALHDNGWQEWEPGDHRTPLGTPRHFAETTMADVVRQSERALRRVEHSSLFAALLVAEHVRSLYGRLDDADVQAWLRTLTPRRARWRRALGVTHAEVAAHYPLLRWADTLSLVLCQDALPTDGLRTEIGTLPGADAPTFAWRAGDGRVGLDPWPYAPDAVEASVEVYRLRQLTFGTDAALARAMARAVPTTRAWSLGAR